MVGGRVRLVKNNMAVRDGGVAWALVITRIKKPASIKIKIIISR
jgi:hypothetical protein